MTTKPYADWLAATAGSSPIPVIPAEAGIQVVRGAWVPVYTGTATRPYAIWLAATAGSSACTMFSYSAAMSGLATHAGLDISM